MDRLTKERRSWLMSRVASKNTKPEKAVRSWLHRHGFRFRLHRKDLPGRPDIVMPKSKTVIFVHGCFWHRHPGCRKCTTPSTNVEFWKEKFRKNTERDVKNLENLKSLGWRVIVVWECEVLSGSFQQRLKDELSYPPASQAPTE